MTNSAYPDQLASSSQLIWIYTVYKGRAYPGSARLELTSACTKLYALCPTFKNNCYGKCPKILYTKVPDKKAYANSADPDQMAPSEAVWSGSTLFAIWLCFFKKQLYKKQN